MGDTMKVVETDNRGSDYPYEVLVVAGVSESAAQKLADLINEELCRGDSAPRFWKVVPEDYILTTEGPC